MYIGPRSPALVDVWMIVNIFACEKIEKTCAGRIELDHRISYTLRGSRFLVAVTRKAAFAIWWQLSPSAGDNGRGRRLRGGEAEGLPARLRLQVDRPVPVLPDVPVPPVPQPDRRVLLAARRLHLLRAPRVVDDQLVRPAARRHRGARAVCARPDRHVRAAADRRAVPAERLEAVQRPAVHRDHLRPGRDPEERQRDVHLARREGVLVHRQGRPPDRRRRAVRLGTHRWQRAAHAQPHSAHPAPPPSTGARRRRTRRRRRRRTCRATSTT